MKVAVYTIAKNEEKHVDRFMACLRNEADDVYVLDTGSTDKTVERLKDQGATVDVGLFKPWRFDTPRNVSLAMVPMNVDICVCIDLDEELTPGWRAEVEKAWVPGTTRLRYPYAWSHREDGSPATKFFYDKIHQRRGYRWVKPVHEILSLYDEPEVQSWTEGFMLHHWPDTSKSRGSYLPLLELAVKEEPHDDRSCHYLGREYMYYGMYEKAIAELTRHLALPSATWNSERAASMRFISRCLLALNRPQDAKSWALKACVEAPTDREPLFELAKVAYRLGDFNLLFYSAEAALKSGEFGKSYISDPEAWGYMLYDFGALGAYNIGFKKRAVELGTLALEKAKELREHEQVTSRLEANLVHYINFI